ncbi:O-antigen ligase family protein [Caenimonas terrae]|uniref:O-antigen ligase family protein n=1 Tax=Caenimonas terrae TaxID=696074 RepID=A0ABW0NH16_9BURK
MARKKRNPAQATPAAAALTAAAAPVRAPAASARPAAAGLPAEITGDDWTVAFLMLAVFLAPALGVPYEEMLQDTLKSIVVSFAALAAALMFFWHQRRRSEPLRWHAIVWLPLMLMAYALGSMAWSHTYLGAVEAIRWFIFSVIVWLGLNTLSRERLPWLGWGVHGGAAIAALWAVLQFLVDFRLFPQGPNPASTFVNRNFFAEFAVCTLPFSALLLLRARQTSQIALLAITSGLVLVAILMTGTRSALTAMWLQLLVVLPLIAWLYRKQLAIGQWDALRRVLAAGLLLITVLALGSIPTANNSIRTEARGNTGLERGFKRTAAISPNDASIGIRMVMWKATATMIRARPFSGVGAGAWESDIPLYQATGEQLETDFYVHNEFLQLLAEYGLVGWAFMLSLFAYLIASAWRTLRDKTEQGLAEAPLRALVLCSLLALMMVSNMGFPWRMASTGALFAVCLAALAASDARLGIRGRWAAMPLRWRPAWSRSAALASVACIALAIYITQQAALAEKKIVRATKLALSISSTGDYNNPKYNRYKSELLGLIREGIAINRHYRKITPLVADELARWGDWTDAIWIWESVLSSRPYIVAIMTNIARGYASTGNPQQALVYLERAARLQPDAPAVRSLEVILLSRSGKNDEALALARKTLDQNVVDYDLLRATVALARRAGDYPLAVRALQLMAERLPQARSSAYLELGNLYYSPQLHDPARALDAFRSAIEMTPAGARPALQTEIPQALWNQLGLTGSAPPASTQTSASSK